MGIKNDCSFNRIELRSEKIRKIIGTVPLTLLRFNFAIVVIIVVILMLVVFYVPYPYGEDETIFHHIFFS